MEWNKKNQSKKNLKQIKSNQKNEDYYWNKIKVGGQLLILIVPARFLKIEERKERENSIMAKPMYTHHPYKMCRHSTLGMT
jgi:hypothetical protein